jgi:hypothetical protein
MHATERIFGKPEVSTWTKSRYLGQLVSRLGYFVNTLYWRRSAAASVRTSSSRTS